jgi:hypothetical protein
MEKVGSVTIDFSVKGADPNNKLAADARCATCDRLITEHSRDDFRECGRKQREATKADNSSTAHDAAAPAVRRIISILAIVALALLGLFTVIGTLVATWKQDAVYYAIIIKHYPATIGLPISATAALVVVFLLEYTAGPIEAEGFGFKFKGASGPLLFWILSFLAINASIAGLWSREFQSPIADQFLEELLSVQAHSRAMRRCRDEVRSQNPSVSETDLAKRCLESPPQAKPIT